MQDVPGSLSGSSFDALVTSSTCMQIMPCMNLVNKTPKKNPAVCHLLLHILYTVLRNTRHKRTLQPTPLGVPTAQGPVPGIDAPHAVTEHTVHDQRSSANEAPEEPATDALCSSAPSALPSEAQSWSTVAKEGGHLEVGFDSAAPAGCFRGAFDEDSESSCGRSPSSGVVSCNGDITPRSVESSRASTA